MTPIKTSLPPPSTRTADDNMIVAKTFTGTHINNLALTYPLIYFLTNGRRGMQNILIGCKKLLKEWFSPVYSSPFVNSGYRADIDGLRAIAILAVIFFHAFPEYITGGFVGVDVFFIISGYLITGIIYRALIKNSFSFSDFYARRIRRIFPALLFLLVIITIITLPFLTFGERIQLGKQIKWASFFSENIYIVKQGAGYFALKTELMPLMHLWSLGVEEQYYIIYPLLCFIIWKINKNWILASLLFFSVASFFSSVLLFDYFPNGTFFLLHSRFWELCLGGILAIFHQKGFNDIPILDSKKHQEFFSFMGLTFILLGIFLFNNRMEYPGVLTLLPTLGTCLIIASPKATINRYLSIKSFVFIGLISYTWYLWHWPFLALVRSLNKGELPSFEFRLLLIFISLLFALFSYFYIEFPIRKKKLNFVLITSLCVLMGITGMLGSLAPRTSFIFPESYQKFVNFEKNKKNSFRNNACDEIPLQNVRYCWKSGDSPAEWAIIGDSHAKQLATGLGKLTSAPIIILGNPGDPPLLGVKNPRTFKLETSEEIPSSNIIHWIAKSPSIKFVILSARWERFSSQFRYSFDNKPVRSGHLNIFEKQLVKTIQLLKNSGKEVFVLLDNPHLPFDIEDCFSLRPIETNKPSTCSFPASEGNETVDLYNKVVTKVTSQLNVPLINPSSVFCEDGVCKAEMNGRLLYEDRDHLSDFGASEVAKKIIEDINSTRKEETLLPLKPSPSEG